jgi:hypothetical protein
LHPPLGIAEDPTGNICGFRTESVGGDEGFVAGEKLKGKNPRRGQSIPERAKRTSPPGLERVMRQKGSRTGMKIAIDTLFEHPDHPTGSIDYLRSVAGTFPRIAPQHDYYLLVSKHNIRHFCEFERSNLHFVQCFRSNENMPVRILLQQTLIPIRMKQHKIEVLFAPGNVCPFRGNFCRVLKVNTLHQYHIPKDVGRTRAVYRQFLFEKSARRANHILANTFSTKEEICRLMRVPEEKVTVTGKAFYDIYHPVAQHQTRNVLAKHGLQKDYILFVSTLYPYKNTATLIKSYAHLLRQQLPDTELAIVGRLNSDDRYRPACFQTAADAFQAYAKADIIYRDFAMIDGNGRVWQIRREIRFSRFVLSYHRVLYVPTNAAFLRRRVFDEGNYIDVQFDHAMDYEFFMRLAHRGYRFKHISYLLADYRWHPGSKSVSQAAKQLGEHDRIAQSYSPVLQKLRSSLANKLALRALRLMAASRRYAEKFVWGYYFEQFRPPATLVERSR